MKKALLKLGLIISPFFILTIGLVAQVRADDHPYGWSPDLSGGSKGPPACTDARPDKPPILLQPNHPVLPKKAKSGEVVLYWHRVPGATGYNIYYGLSPRNYIFSAANIGDTDNFTVGFLPNRVFYFVVQAKKGCAASSFSNEWAVRPGGGGYINTRLLGASTGITTVKKKTVPSSYQQPIIEPTTVPTSTPQVQGIKTERQVYQPPVYHTQVPLPTVAPVKSKPSGIIAFITKLLFGK